MSDLQQLHRRCRERREQQVRRVQAVLCWTEFYNGKWQPTKTSDVNHPTSSAPSTPTGPGSFESLPQPGPDRARPAHRHQPLIEAIYGADIRACRSDALMLAISARRAITGPAGFILHNTHSLPVRFEDISIPEFRTSSCRCPMSSTRPARPGPFPRPRALHRRLRQRHLRPSTTSPPGQPRDLRPTTSSSTPGCPACVEPQPGLPDAWDAPFLYEDRRNLFYVTTTESWSRSSAFPGFGILSGQPRPARPPRCAIAAAGAAPADGRGHAAGRCWLAQPRPRGGDPAAVQRFLSGTARTSMPRWPCR